MKRSYDGLIAVNVSDLDRRSRTVGLTKNGFNEGPLIPYGSCTFELSKDA
jgi:hypothetical protein